MSKFDVLDLCELANEWRDLDLDDEADAKRADVYAHLCAELDIDTSPDALEHYGEDYEPTLIHGDYFTTYAQELAEDCAPFSRNSEIGEVLMQWPYRCIDWEQAARELKYDYTARGSRVMRYSDETEYMTDTAKIVSVWSTYGHRFIDAGENISSCLICGAEYQLLAHADDPTRGEYMASNGDESRRCMGDTSMAHGYPGERHDGNVDHNCNCVLCH